MAYISVHTRRNHTFNGSFESPVFALLNVALWKANSPELMTIQVCYVHHQNPSYSHGSGDGYHTCDPHPDPHGYGSHTRVGLLGPTPMPTYQTSPETERSLSGVSHTFLRRPGPFTPNSPPTSPKIALLTTVLCVHLAQVHFLVATMYKY